MTVTGASLIAPADLDFLAALAGITPAAGALVEIGVYRGGSAARLYAVAQNQGRRLFLYDTFQGHPPIDPDRDNSHEHPTGRFGHNAIDPDALRQALPGAEVVVGAFPYTLVNMDPVGFVHVDCDLYWPTLHACQLLPRQTLPGAVLYFDDYSRTEGCPGVRAAVDEVFGPGKALPNGNRMVML